MKPEYVKCVMRTHGDHKRETWCGKIDSGWVFVDAAHAAENGAAGGRLLVCPECRNAIIRALSNGES